MSDGLFNPEAFEQVPGQMSMEQVEPTFDPPAVGSFVTCPRCGCACRVQSHNHAHCVQCFSGFRTDRP